ncbi:MAG: PIN domain-containing protein [Fimbriimonas sp.]
MSPVVVDSDVVSYLFKQDTRAEAFRPLITGRLAVISFMTAAELYYWSDLHQWGTERRIRLDSHLRRFVIDPFDMALCQAWSSAMVSARRKGRPIQTADAWVAATALVHGLPLVTNNPSDFMGVDGLTVLTAP